MLVVLALDEASWSDFYLHLLIPVLKILPVK